MQEEGKIYTTGTIWDSAQMRENLWQFDQQSKEGEEKFGPRDEGVQVSVLVSLVPTTDLTSLALIFMKRINTFTQGKMCCFQLLKVISTERKAASVKSV